MLEPKQPLNQILLAETVITLLKQVGNAGVQSLQLYMSKALNDTFQRELPVCC